MKRRPPDTEWVFHADDAAVLRALETGKHEESLREFFGLEAYTDLSALAAQAARERVQRQTKRGAVEIQKVLILPGIMGSKLGRAKAAVAAGVLWIDPLRIAAGQLTQLALPRGAGLKPLGVMLFTYAKIKLMLDIAGFDARFHAYDWRLNLSELGAQLAQRILKEERPVVLVAHSMGGLVARSAMSLLPKRCVRRAILIGTPNAGTIAPVQALCGTYPAVRRIAMLDLKHSVEFLAKQVFSSFPGLYQLLPTPDAEAPVNIYDPSVWPKKQSRPDPALLQQAATARDSLAPPDERFRQIIGIAQDTIVGIRRDAGGFAYEVKPAGDGTVPVASALLRDVPAYYIAEIHGSLTNNSQVIHCVVDLIKNGRSKGLPQRRSPSHVKSRWVTDHELRRHFHPKIDWRRLDSAGRERLLTQFSGNAQTKADPRPRRKIELRIAYGNIADAEGSALVLGIFRNVAPGGAAMAVDARLNGAIREFTARRMFSGDTGQIFAMPAGSRKLRAKSVVFAGMGDFDNFDAQMQVFVSENVVRTLARTRVHDFVTVLFGTGSGLSVADVVANQLRGYFRALDAADPGYDLRRITFCVYDQRRLRQLRTALRNLKGSDVFTRVDVTITQTRLRSMPVAVLGKPRAAPAATSPAPPTAYLILSQDSTDGPGDGIVVRSSLLSAGAKAAVLSCRQPIRGQGLESLLDDLHGGDFDEHSLKRYGERLGALMLHPDMRNALLQSKSSHLAVVHDAAMSQLPWETLSIGAWTPAMTAGMSRRYAAENLSVARWSETRRLGDTLDVLLVANPTQDLPGAQVEAQRLISVFTGRADIRLHVVQGALATRTRLLNDFRSGSFDVVHYAGHAHFDEHEPQRSGIICAGGEILSGADLSALQSLPALVFFNACESGRLRAAKPGRRIRRSLATTDGLAESFLRGGVANYLGTYWPVGDDAALAFSTALYSTIVAGSALGHAINRARAAVRAAHSCDWADYMHYGSYEFSIKGP